MHQKSMRPYTVADHRESVELQESEQQPALQFFLLYKVARIRYGISLGEIQVVSRFPRLDRSAFFENWKVRPSVCEIHQNRASFSQELTHRGCRGISSFFPLQSSATAQSCPLSLGHNCPFRYGILATVFEGFLDHITSQNILPGD